MQLVHELWGTAMTQVSLGNIVSCFSALLTAWLITWLDTFGGPNVLFAMVWFIIPIGTFLAGAGGASGIFLVAYLAEKPPPTRTFLWATAFALATLLLCYLFTYLHDSARGPFFSYIAFLLRGAQFQTAIEYRHHELDIGNSHSFWGGWLTLGILQLMGALFGGFSMAALAQQQTGIRR